MIRFVKRLGIGFLSLGIVIIAISLGLLMASRFREDTLLSIVVALLSSGATLTVAGATLIYVNLTYSLVEQTKLVRERETYQQIADKIIRPLIDSISKQSEDNREILASGAYIEAPGVTSHSPGYGTRLYDLQKGHPILYREFTKEERDCLWLIEKHEEARNSVANLARSHPRLPSSILQRIRGWAIDYQQRLLDKGLRTASSEGIPNIPDDRGTFRLLVERKGELHQDSFSIGHLIAYIASGGQEDYKPPQNVYKVFLEEYKDKLLELAGDPDMSELKEGFSTFERFIKVGEELINKLQNVLGKYLDKYGISLAS